MNLRHLSEEDLQKMIRNRDTVRGGVVGTRTYKDRQTRLGVSLNATSIQGRHQEALKSVAGSNPAPSLLTLTLLGQLPSGKNQVQLLWRNGKVMKYPNKTFTAWRQAAHVDILVQSLQHEPLTVPVHLTVRYTPGDARTRDVSGQLDALFHLLVYSKVLKDDGLVYDVTWRRQAMNRKSPQVVLTIEEVQP
jgi:Holliday junction resolvase RusA-like endonuclease